MMYVGIFQTQQPITWPYICTIDYRFRDRFIIDHLDTFLLVRAKGCEGTVVPNDAHHLDTEHGVSRIMSYMNEQRHTKT